MMLIWLPNIDRKAALLAGHEVGPSPSVSINIPNLGDDRAAVIEALDLHPDGTGTLKLSVEAPTLDAILKAVRAKLTKAEQANSVYRGFLADVAQWADEIATLEPAPIRKLQFWDDSLATNLGPYDGFTEPAYPHASPFDSRCNGHSSIEVLATPEFTAYTAAKQKLLERVKAADQAAKDAARPTLLEARHERERERQAAAVAEKEAREKAVAEQAAKRLETGHWERDTPSYNPRRDGKPWCARVTKVDERGRLVYEWGEWTGRIGEAGLLRLPCSPGDVIAWGQRDNRHADRSEHHILHMQEDGTMVEMTAAEAAKILRR